jgi:hypothetical protein
VTAIGEYLPSKTTALKLGLKEKDVSGSRFVCRQRRPQRTGEHCVIPSLPLLIPPRKRPRDDNEESSNDAYHGRENGPGKKSATGSAEFVVDLEIADEVEVSVSPHNRKRKRSIEIDGAEK